MVPAYNVQTVVDAEHALIVTHEVTTEARITPRCSDGGSGTRCARAVDSQRRGRRGLLQRAQAEALEAQGIVAHIPANRAVTTRA